MAINKKGFTLFTALVSLLLLSMSLILVFNMVQTEETYLYLISDKSSMSDLITIADLARADAFNSFLVHLRHTWESHYSNPTNYLSLNITDVYLPWDEFVTERSDALIFSRSFANFFANVLVNQLRHSALQPQGYNVNVDLFGDVDEINPNNITTSQEVLGGIIQKLFLNADPKDKIKVVDCEYDSSDRCIGSFYMSLDVTTLDDVNFERLPKISVVSQRTNEVIQKPIFGRFNYRIYMPWRGWQALRVARRFALEENIEKVESLEEKNAVFEEIGNGNNTGHKGLYDGYLINTLNQARLGFCDPKTCAPRTSFYKSPDTTYMGYQCGSSSDTNFSIDFSSPLHIKSHEITYNQSSTEYNVFNVGGTATKALLDLFSDTVEENVTERYLNDSENILFENNLKMVHRSSYLENQQTNSRDISVSSNNIQDINFTTLITTTSTVTKKIIAESGGVQENLDTFSFSVNNISSSVGGFGTFVVSEDNQKDLLLLGSNIINKFKPSQDIGPSELRCYQLSNATIQLSFEEEDRRYVVGDSSKIHVNLSFSFSGFAFPPSIGNNAFENQLSFDETGFLTGYSHFNNPNINPNIPIEDWTCYSHTDIQVGQKCVAK